MSDLLNLIGHAWETRVKPILDRDPDELQRRLARRRAGMMRRPPRAWCLAIRASDQRINPATAACCPEIAAYPAKDLGGRYAGQVLYDRHTVTLTAELLRRVCRPAFTPIPGLDARTLGSELGVSPCNLKTARERGTLSVKHDTRLSGRVGRRVAVLFTRELLNPGHQLFQHDDPLWGTHERWPSDHVPDDLEQTLVRVPVWQVARRWTKAFGYEVSEQFIGWRWECPACRKTCRTLYYPLPPLRVVRLLGHEFHDADANHPDAWPAPMRTFACTRCHGVLYFTRSSADKWNHLIAHLTGGLVYGHEVPRPAWYQQRRTRAFRPRLRGASSRRREQVLALVRDGLSYDKVALRLGVSKSTVNSHVRKLFRMHHVKGVEALRALLAPLRSETSKLKIQETNKVQSSNLNDQTKAAA